VTILKNVNVSKNVNAFVEKNVDVTKPASRQRVAKKSTENESEGVADTYNIISVCILG
jgi:hypothetical protein